MKTKDKILRQLGLVRREKVKRLLGKRDSDLKDRIEKLDRLDNEHEKLKLDYNELLNNFKTSEHEKEKLRKDFENLKVSFNKLDKKFNNLERAYNHLKEEYNDLEEVSNDYDNLCQKKSDLKEDYDRLEKKYNKLEREYNKLKNRHDKRKETVQNLNQKYFQRKENVKSLLNEIARTANMINSPHTKNKIFQEIEKARFTIDGTRKDKGRPRGSYKKNKQKEVNKNE